MKVEEGCTWVGCGKAWSSEVVILTIYHTLYGNGTPQIPFNNVTDVNRLFLKKRFP
jgi:hypothetical protein